jgi:hypothetical protein
MSAAALAGEVAAATAGTEAAAAGGTALAGCAGPVVVGAQARTRRLHIQATIRRPTGSRPMPRHRFPALPVAGIAHTSEICHPSTSWPIGVPCSRRTASAAKWMVPPI